MPQPRTLTAPVAALGASLVLVGSLAGCSSLLGSSATATRIDVRYADGVYSGNGEYTSPNGRENIVVFVTLENNLITDVTVTPGSNNPTVAYYQGQFSTGIAAEVVGKRVDELDVTRVAGSSLTSGGFREALEQISSQARL